MKGVDASNRYYVPAIVAGYALSSALLAIINKFAVTMFSYPAILTALQYLTSVAGVRLFSMLGLLQHDPFTYDMARKFLPAATIFYLAVFTNTELLKNANVETFVIFRSLTPLLVAVSDTVFRKQPWPSSATFASLVVILAGAVGYVSCDSTFTLTAYSWAFAYLVVITTEMVYIKHMVMNLGLNTWGFVYYNNLISLMIAPVFWLVTGEFQEILALLNPKKLAEGDSDSNTMITAVAVVASCIFGLSISFFGFAARKAISATAFTVTGVVNKLLTVLINVAVWDKHATPSGLGFLLVTIGGGAMYQQSVRKPLPKPEHKSDVEKATEDHREEIKGLMDGHQDFKEESMKGFVK
ncbi:GDP-mannose transporter [Nymphaea thermarum]|nr:GDP-mannose transporter [Nymphaea thermarum]